jgi:hypothetical protein
MSPSIVFTFIKTKTEMDSKKIAKAIKQMLVKLAVTGKLPTDMNELATTGIEEILKTAAPNQLQKVIESAGYYLSDSELTMAEQVALIAKANEDEMLINIEGVVEWEPLQGRYTASEFLDLIGY